MKLLNSIKCSTKEVNKRLDFNPSASHIGYSKALGSGGELTDSGSTEAIGDANAYLRSSGLHLLAKGAKLSQKPRGGWGGVC